MEKLTRRAILTCVPAVGFAAIAPAAAMTVEPTPRERLDAAIAELKTAAEAIWPTANDWMIELDRSPSVPVFINAYDPGWKSRS